MGSKCVWHYEPDSGHQGYAPDRLTAIDTTTGKNEVGIHFEVDITLGIKDDRPRHSRKGVAAFIINDGEEGTETEVPSPGSGKHRCRWGRGVDFEYFVGHV